MSSNHTDPRPTDEIISAALAAEDDDEYWDFVGVLHYRATREVFETARALTQSDDPDQRSLGVHVLSQFGIPDRSFPEETKALLLDLLRCETDEDVIADICYGFSHNPEFNVVEPVAALKRHPDPGVREAVVFGLLRLTDESAIRTLTELSTDPEDEVRNWATFGLGMQIDTDTPEIRQALVRALSDPFDAVRGEALRGLARRNDERVIEPLIKELEVIAQADEWYDYAFEAAEHMPDPRLYPALAAAGDGGIEDRTLDHAIALCRTPAPEEGRDKPTAAPTRCPVCGLARAFKLSDDWQFCRRCGWEYDPDQRTNPDSIQGYNRRSLNQERERWRKRLEAGRR